jgi:hypothetical protein
MAKEMVRASVEVQGRLVQGSVGYRFFTRPLGDSGLRVDALGLMWGGGGTHRGCLGWRRLFGGGDLGCGGVPVRGGDLGRGGGTGRAAAAPHVFVFRLLTRQR